MDGQSDSGEAEGFDREELELIEENKRSSSFKRLYRRNEVAEDELENLFNNDPQTTSDDIDDFIDDNIGSPEDSRKTRHDKRKYQESGALRELLDIFGDGTDYPSYKHEPVDNLREEEETKNESIRLEDIFEPQVLSEGMFTERDESIKNNDWPERFQLKGLKKYYKMEDSKNSMEHWIYSKISKKHTHTINEVKTNAFLLESVSNVIKFISEGLEVPFIATYRKEYVASYLNLDDLWFIYDNYLLWDTFSVRRNKVVKAIQSISDKIDDFNLLVEWIQKETGHDSFDDLYEYVRYVKSNKEDNFGKIAHHFKKYLGISFNKLGMNLLEEVKIFEPEDVSLGPSQVLHEFILENGHCNMEVEYERELSGDGGDSSMLEMIASALSQDLAANPLVRKGLMKHFEKSFRVSSEPTPKCFDSNIMDESLNYIKCINKKPFERFKRDEYFDLLKLENENFVNVKTEFELSEETRDKILYLFTSERYSPIGEKWNEFRRSIIEKAFPLLCRIFDKRVLASLRKKTLEYTICECKKSVIEKTFQGNLYALIKTDIADDDGEYKQRNILSLAPGYPDADQFGSYEGSTPNIMYMVVVGEEGDLIYTAKLGEITRSSEKRDDMFNRLLKMVVQFDPLLICLSGFSSSVKTLYMDIKTFVLTNKDKILKNIPVILVDDEVARIYMVSERAHEEFPSLPSIFKYLVSNGRRVIEPVLEIARLDSDILKLNINKYQNMIESVSLQELVERQLVNTINLIGIDVNRAVRYEFFRIGLQYVGGLGPRKAKVICNAANNSFGGYFLRRSDMLDFLGKSVFRNCSGFLKIGKRYLRNKPLDFDLLDTTRIHPEDYEIAKKMITDALELNKNPVPDTITYNKIIKLAQNDHSKLDELLLDDYSHKLRNSLKLEKSFTLRDIREELKEPFADKRPFKEVDRERLFEMVSGIKHANLMGKILKAKIIKIGERSCIGKLREYGLTGPIRTDVPEKALYIGKILDCKVIGVNLENLSVDMSSRKSDILRRDARIDEYYDLELEKVLEEKYCSKKNSHHIHQARPIIKHNLFKNINRLECETELLNAGDLSSPVIRPSSKGKNIIVISWLVLPTLVNHMDISVDKNDSVKSFSIGNEKYDDLDEVLARFFEPINNQLQEVIDHHKFFASIDQQEVEAHLLDKKFGDNSNRNAVPYCFSLLKDFPLKVLFSFLPAKKVFHDLITVSITHYSLRDNNFSSIGSLVDWFKQDYTIKKKQTRLV